MESGGSESMDRSIKFPLGNKHRTLIVLLSMFFFVFPSIAQARVAKVDLFLTRGPGDMFYHLVEGFGQAAAADLDMELKVHYADGNHILMVQQVEQALSNADKPDALVFINFKQRDKQIIELAEAAKVPVIVMNSGVTPEFDLGKPREKYEYWIGELLPDDRQAGYELANRLIALATPAEDGKVYLFAIEGEHHTGASVERVKGLFQAVSEHKYVVLTQLVAGNWDPRTAGQKYIMGIRRYPQISVVWAASDGMALGVVDSALKLGRKIPEHIGGIDWTLEAKEALEEGSIDVSMGGHFMEAAWVLVMLHDYFKGKDFAEVGVSLRDPMYPMTQYNSEKMALLMKPSSWKSIDFKAFSRFYNPGLDRYPFSVGQVLSQLSESAQVGSQ
ncbi:ABC transporter substrate-binding protein [Corallincola platygyrae]|uniref:ABC transporter substrate-binding protein n=1 Tax=Corallincola platygyrae TaxID=1193278 RepID=A0ABW4XS54_9GAMM